MDSENSGVSRPKEQRTTSEVNENTHANEHEHGGLTHAIEHSLHHDTSEFTIDRDLHVLKSRQHWWAQEATLDERIQLLEETLKLLDEHTKEWIELDGKTKKVGKEHWDYATGFYGPAGAAMFLHTNIDALKSMKENGLPKLYSKIEQIGNQVRLQVVPQNTKDSIIFNGLNGYIYLEEGTSVDKIDSYQARFYKDKDYKGGVSLVLGAGNYAHLTFGDSLDKLIVDKEVVILKVHPVLDYMYDISRKILRPFIQAGVLRVIKGGAEVGKYLTYHNLVDDVHMTGSDKTFEAIVYGGGEEGLKNKEKDNRVLKKPITGELGCVSPVIIVPGEWSDSDIEYQAKNIISMLGFNEGYTCCALRILVLPKKWSGSEKLLAKIRQIMKDYKLNSNFYPGTNERIELARKHYPGMEEVGVCDATHQPWMLVDNLDPKKEEFAFQNEVWAAFFGVVYLDEATDEDYLKAAVDFSNTKLWGTLSATIIVDPKTEKKLEANGHISKAVNNLRYGTVAINIFPGISNVMGVLPWGGYPGSTYNNIQSGNGFVGNTLMLDHVEKSYLHAPFHISPEPGWFITNKKVAEVNAAFAVFLIRRGWMDLFRTIFTAMGMRKQEY